ncbi:MAG TPA: ABC transporter permease subunit, partial [Acidimicrobiia bacterium]|nr:ABC transporter permease subunit [Acidimicrobiia bacterium]
IDRSLSVTSPPGYLVSQVFGFILPLLFVVLAVALASRSIAGEEEQGTLDLLLAQPVSRRRVVTERFLAVATVVVGLGVGSWVILAGVSPLFDLRAALGSLAIATLASTLFGLQVGATAFAVGAAVGRRGASIATASTVALLAFLIESLAQLTDVFERVRFLSPWYYANGNIPMVHGLRALDLAVLVGVTLAAAAVAIVAFERRDLT